ncbi:hypothetical protein [Flavobacterium psychrophilum]|uniref:hypothetical protein n=1 Tax=Flavobacterium psychrophilum TaxID=96345 RepID=UPI001D0766DC|nr:hypothetical protein [Flavobacterium psychrophilum]MCB6099436.1 hypothetical protein [Flavobacterium psychrophilum]
MANSLENRNTENNMDNNLTLIIIGLYTLIYVFVFIIQKSQIDKQKDVISSMKSFMEIFNVDEVKKYVEMKNERIIEDASMILTNDAKFKKMSDHLIRTATEPIKELYKEAIQEKNIELIDLAFKLIMMQEPNKREQFIHDFLFKNKDYFMDILNDYEKRNS